MPSSAKRRRLAASSSRNWVVSLFGAHLFEQAPPAPWPGLRARRPATSPRRARSARHRSAESRPDRRSPHPRPSARRPVRTGRWHSGSPARSRAPFPSPHLPFRAPYGYASRRAADTVLSLLNFQRYLLATRVTPRKAVPVSMGHYVGAIRLLFAPLSWPRAAILGPGRRPALRSWT